MTTGLQLALLGGALVGLGLSLIVWRLLPADPDPVDVVHRYSPEGVRARAAANGTNGVHPGGEGGVVVTPPGPGGDVHGDPGLPGSTPTPPSPGSAGPT